MVIFTFQHTKRLSFTVSPETCYPFHLTKDDFEWLLFFTTIRFLYSNPTFMQMRWVNESMYLKRSHMKALMYRRNYFPKCGASIFYAVWMYAISLMQNRLAFTSGKLKSVLNLQIPSMFRSKYYFNTKTLLNFRQYLIKMITLIILILMNAKMGQAPKYNSTNIFWMGFIRYTNYFSKYNNVIHYT